MQAVEQRSSGFIPKPLGLHFPELTAWFDENNVEQDKDGRKLASGIVSLFVGKLVRSAGLDVLPHIGVSPRLVEDRPFLKVYAETTDRQVTVAVTAAFQNSVGMLDNWEGVNLNTELAVVDRIPINDPDFMGVLDYTPVQKLRNRYMATHLGNPDFSQLMSDFDILTEGL